MANESPASILYDENGDRAGVAVNPIQVTGFTNPSNFGITGPVRVDRVGITGPVGPVGVTGPVRVDSVGITGPVGVTFPTPLPVTGYVGVTGVRVDSVGITGPVRVDRVGITGFVQVTGPIGVTGQVQVVGAVGVTGPVGVTFPNPLPVTGPISVTGPVRVDAVGVTGPVRVDRVGVTGFVQVTGPVGVTGLVQVVGAVGVTGPVVVIQGSAIGNSGAWPVRLTDQGGTAAAGIPSFPIDVRGPRSSSAVVTSVASSLTNVTLLSANSNRIGATVYNDSNRNLFLKLGATASTSSFTVELAAGSYYEVPYGYTGRIDGLWDVVNGNALVTEIT